jgi:AMP-binding enzyme
MLAGGWGWWAGWFKLSAVGSISLAMGFIVDVGKGKWSMSRLVGEGGRVTPYAGPFVKAPVSIGDLLRPGLDADPEGLALISVDTRWTWRTLDRLSSRLAENLLGLELEPGDRVASLMPNRPALVAPIWRVSRRGSSRRRSTIAIWRLRSIMLLR